MPTVKNVSTHVDDLPDGRPIGAYETAEITDDELASSHAQSRIADGAWLTAPDPPAPAVTPPAPVPPKATTTTDQEDAK